MRSQWDTNWLVDMFCTFLWYDHGTKCTFTTQFALLLMLITFLTTSLCSERLHRNYTLVSRTNLCLPLRKSNIIFLCMYLFCLISTDFSLFTLFWVCYYYIIISVNFLPVLCEALLLYKQNCVESNYPQEAPQSTKPKSPPQSVDSHFRTSLIFSFTDLIFNRIAIKLWGKRKLEMCWRENPQICIENKGFQSYSACEEASDRSGLTVWSIWRMWASRTTQRPPHILHLRGETQIHCSRNLC